MGIWILRKPFERFGPGQWLDIVFLPEDIADYFLCILQRILCDYGEVGHKYQTGCKLVEPSPEYFHPDPLCGYNGCLHQGMPGFLKYFPKFNVKSNLHITRNVKICSTMKRPFHKRRLIFFYYYFFFNQQLAFTWTATSFNRRRSPGHCIVDC